LIIIRPLHGLDQARLEVREMSKIIIRPLHGLDQTRLEVREISRIIIRPLHGLDQARLEVLVGFGVRPKPVTFISHLIKHLSFL